MPSPILSNMFYISERCSFFQDLVCVAWQWASYTIAWDSASGSVTAGCLSSPVLSLKAKRILGELLLLSLHWNLKEGSSNAGEGVLPQQDGGTCQREWRDAGKEQRIPSSKALYTWAATARCWPHLGLSALNSVIKNTPHGSTCSSCASWLQV